MSGLVRFSSSSDTVRFDMYQKIQGIRLKKMSREPLKMKKSQKVNGAKIPTRKMISPATSRMTASDAKRTVHLFCSMLAGLRAKVPRQFCECDWQPDDWEAVDWSFDWKQRLAFHS